MPPRRLTISELEWIASRMESFAHIPENASPAPRITHHPDFALAINAMRKHIELLKMRGVESIELSSHGEKLLKDLKLCILPV
jgi:hypothetical protein